jgi:hypothetical protein
MQYENKVGTTKGIHLLNLQGGNHLKGFLNHPRKTTCRQMWHSLERRFKGIKRKFEVLFWLVFFKEK